MGGTEDERNWSGIRRDDADLLAAVVRSSSDAIYSKDAEARITSWNPAAEALYGYSADEVLGQHISLLVPDDRRGEETIILNRILEGDVIEHYETVRVRKDGSLVEVSVSVSPVHDIEGQIVEAAAIARDISDRRRAETEAVQAQRKQALELNDTIVQGLAAAKMALEMKDHERGLQSVSKTLGNAKEVINRLLDDAGEIDPGDLIRDDPATLGDNTV